MKVFISSIGDLFKYVLAGIAGAGAVLLVLKLDPGLVGGMQPAESQVDIQSGISKQVGRSDDSGAQKLKRPFDGRDFMDTRSEDIFAQMRKMHESFFDGGLNDFFESNLMDLDSGLTFSGKGLSSGAKITSREDQNYLYYEIAGDSIENTSVSTSVEDGYLTITAEIHSGDSKAENDGSAGSSFLSSFQSTMQRTFPLPGNIDESKMETLAEGSKIILRFPKVNS